jgi:type VI secretion system secreted protein VgrG
MSYRTLQVHSPAIPEFLGRPALEPVRLSGREGLNSLFEYELLLKTPDDLNLGASGAADWDLDRFIGRELSCTIQLDGMGEFLPGAVGASVDHRGAGERQINALITEACLWGEEGRHVQYKLTLRPWLHLATLTTDCKIFQNKTVLDILDELLADYAFPVDKRLIGLDGADGALYPTRDYQTQYNESDFEFFSRLTQEWGISYFFEHSEGKHRLVLTDAMGAYKKNDSAAYQEVEYHAPGWKVDAEYIHSFVPASSLTSGQYTSRDYDYTRPKADLNQSRKDPRPTGQADAKVYQWHAGSAGSHYAQPRAGSAEANDPQAEGRQLALLRMQALRTAGSRAQASGNLRGMVPGCTFRLHKHPRQQANAEYLILDTRLLIEDVAQDSQIQNAAPDRKQHWKVEVDFTAHPVTEPLRPALTQQKPFTHGPQTALVVGPEGQNLWTDEYGRIKVQFPWDRLGQKSQHSSCWIRVSSPWAGNQLGGVQLPRIGQEVIVDFLGGDPDLPVCTGRVHNQSNLPPWALPGQSALSGFRSRELTKEGGNSAAGRSNHLILDDTESKIQVQLKSDHQHSQLSLGHITRIEDNAGRKDPRGEGFELRTDGHGVLRAADGLLISTEARGNAANHAKDMGETSARLQQAQDQHEQLADAARTHKAQQAGQDQEAVSRALRAQNEAIQGKTTSGAPTDAGAFPELSAPHLVLASPAGIEASTPESIHLHSGEHTAFTSGGHSSMSIAKRFLASAADGFRAFTHKKGIKWIASEGPVEIEAYQDEVVLLAHKDVRITSIDGEIHVTAKKKIVVIGGGSYSEWSASGIRHGTAGTWQEHAALHAQVGPMSIDQAHPVPPTPSLAEQQDILEEHFVLVEHASGLRLPQQKYRIVFAGGRTVEGQTNDQGETDVVQSMVAQIATVQVLRNAEDGVLASYTPLVQTPAEQAYEGVVMGMTAEKREQQKVGGKAHEANADKATSEGKAPVYTSCDPNNWGMRKSEPKAKDAARWEYPVVNDYVKAIKPALTAIEWKQATWPLSDADFESLLGILKTNIKGALAKTAFGLPAEAMPKVLIPRDAEARELGLNPDDKDLKGQMQCLGWLLVACKGGVTSMIDAAKSGDPDELTERIREFASTLYHEARHAQQFFWVAAMAHQFPQDYAAMPNMRGFWKSAMPSEIFELAGTIPVPDEPSARAGLHRMVIGMYYWQLTRLAAAVKRNPGKRFAFADILPTELPLARKAAYDLLEHVGLGGLSIDVDAMAKGEGGSPGYRMQPWEEDSFVCDELVKRLWGGDPGILLPEPGFCTTALRYTLQSRGNGTPGEAGHAH